MSLSVSFRKILVAIDGFRASSYAADHAINLAQKVQSLSHYSSCFAFENVEANIIILYNCAYIRTGRGKRTKSKGKEMDGEY